MSGLEERLLKRAGLFANLVFDISWKFLPEAHELLRRHQLLFLWRASHSTNDMVTKTDFDIRKMIMVLTYMDFNSWLIIVYVVVLYCLYLYTVLVLPVYVVKLVLEYCTFLGANQIYHIISYHK